MPTELLALGDEAFVSLTTFRRSGDAVATPVWIARDGDALVVTTPIDSGKVKRLRNSSRIAIQPCNRMGKVADGAPILDAVAAIVENRADVDRSTALIKQKYGLEFSIITGIERLSKRGRAERVILRITAV